MNVPIILLVLTRKIKSTILLFSFGFTIFFSPTITILHFKFWIKMSTRINIKIINLVFLNYNNFKFRGVRLRTSIQQDIVMFFERNIHCTKI